MGGGGHQLPGFAGVEVGLWGDSSTAPKGTRQSSTLSHPSHTWPAPTLPPAWTKSSQGHTLSLQPPSLGPWGAGEVWAKAVGVLERV